MDFTAFPNLLAQHGHIWLVTLILVVAAVIDGWLLKVPNWLTFPFIIAGWVFSSVFAGSDPWYAGLGYSLAGTAVGFALLYPFCAINFMGAGDVKLLMGVGAWIHVTNTWYAFCATVVIGAVLAVAMAAFRGEFTKHYQQFWCILDEVNRVRDPQVIAEKAAERKPDMLLLPYGIPIAIGTIAYFAWTGMLV
jgi:prepilin peptidase CpaA